MPAAALLAGSKLRSTYAETCCTTEMYPLMGVNDDDSAVVSHACALGASSVGLRICRYCIAACPNFTHRVSRFAVTRAEQLLWGLVSGPALLTGCTARRAAGSGHLAGAIQVHLPSGKRGGGPTGEPATRRPLRRCWPGSASTGAGFAATGGNEADQGAAHPEQ